VNIESSSDAQNIRKLILKTAFRANKGHLGSALSICEIVTTIFKVAKLSSDKNSQRDRVVMSKGHAALAWFSALAHFDVIPLEELETYCVDGSLLGTHPDPELPGVDFMTGSLGQGIGFGVGAALAAKIEGSERQVFVVLSDSELNEGSTWESIALAGQLKLDRLVVILDRNGQQALGKTKDILSFGEIPLIVGELGWNVVEVSGHNCSEMSEVIEHANKSSKGPLFVVAETIAGKGVSFMEGKVEWHYMPMTHEQFTCAIGEVDAAIEALQGGR